MVEKENWYLKWFGEDYYRVYSHRDDSEAELQVQYLSSILSLPAHPSILDVACGRGRHVREWEKRGAFAAGVDRSEFALLDGKKSCEDCSSALILSDMRQLPFQGESFDLITSMFTSFGYFETDQEHISLLREWGRVLCPLGNLVIDYLNREIAIKDLVPETVTEDELYTTIQRRSLSEDGKRIRKEIRIKRKECGSEKSFEESVRAYSPEELSTLLSTASFQIQSIAGDFSGSPFTAESERFIVHAQVGPQSGK